jgi:HAD superfamily hydrolase (TIGR01484 family)
MLKSLDPLAQPGIILSFDFDGTLHDPASDPPVPPAFFEKVERLRKSHQALWGINTGRSMPYVIEGFEESRFPFVPDWVVAREREIYFVDADGSWRAHDSWNERCAAEIEALFEQHRGLIERIRREVQEHTGAQWIEMEGEPAGVISRTEEEMEWIVGRVAPMVEAVPELSWQRNSIYLRFGHRDFQKGSALSEVARYYGVAVDCCFAMGDSYNDLEMLDPEYSGMAACPANSLEVVREKVSARGGIVTAGIHADGVMQALDYYFK